MIKGTICEPNTLKEDILLQVLQEVLSREGSEKSALYLATELSATWDALTAHSSRLHIEHNAPLRPEVDTLWGDLRTFCGVQPDKILAIFPSTASIQNDVERDKREIENTIFEWCKQIAAASNYEGSSYEGLADHLCQLHSSADRKPEIKSWSKAIHLASEVLVLLKHVNAALITIISEHMLKRKLEANSAKASFLYAQCSMLLEKLRVVKSQVQVATYTATTVPAMKQVLHHLEHAVEDTANKLNQAVTQLAQYKALGTRFKSLAYEYIAVERQIEEARYQLREIEEFAKLQQVIG